MSSLQETLGDGAIQFLPCRRFATGSGDKGNQKCRKGPTENIRELRRRKERGRVGKFTEQGCQVPGLDGARQAGVGSGGGGGSTPLLTPQPGKSILPWVWPQKRKKKKKKKKKKKREREREERKKRKEKKSPQITDVDNSGGN